MIHEDPLIAASIIEDQYPIRIGTFSRLKQIRDSELELKRSHIDVAPAVYSDFARACATHGVAESDIVETLIRGWMAEHPPQTTGV